MGRDTAKVGSLQRLDLADIDNIQNFVTDYLSLALGGLFGYTRGLLTPPQVRATANARSFTLTAFQVAISEEGGSVSPNEGVGKGDVKLQVVRFDPRDSNHQLNGSAITNGLITFQAGDVGKFLCVSQITVAEDSQNRIFWNVASSTEAAQNTTTTTRTRLAFNWRTIGQMLDNEAPILILTNDSIGDAQRVKLISAWDDYRTYLFLRESDANNWYDHESLIGVSALLDEELRPGTTTDSAEGLEGIYDPGALTVTKDLGLNMLLALYRSRMRRAFSEGSLDQTYSVEPQPWAAQPVHSIKGLNAKLDNHLATDHTLRFQAMIKISKANQLVSFDLLEDLSYNIDSITADVHSHGGGRQANIRLTKTGLADNISHKRGEISYEFICTNSALENGSDVPFFPSNINFITRHNAVLANNDTSISYIFSGNDFEFLVFDDDNFFNEGVNTHNGEELLLKVSIYGELDN